VVLNPPCQQPASYLVPVKLYAYTSYTYIKALPGMHKFQNFRRNLQVLGGIRVIRYKFQNEDPKILEVTVQKLLATAT